jgi:peptidyl-prolyl cis-trans isomerase C
MTTILDRSREAPRPPSANRTDLHRSTPIAVNGVVIPRADIARETQHHPAAKPVEAWLAAAHALVVRELLLQEARRIGIEPVPESDDEGRRETDEEALIRQLIDCEVQTPEPDERECRRIYDQRQQTLRSSDLYAVRHVLLAAPPGELAARSDAKRRAEAIIAAITADPGCFADYAKSCSACPSRALGGSLGQISRGQTVPEFELALATAPVGRIVGTPVETRYGFHVIIVDHKIAGEELPFDLVREAITRWLIERAEQIAIRQYIAMLAGRAEITGINLEASSASFVQ